MPSVRVRENEPFEVALRRFKRTIEKTGLLTELRAREYYEKPTAERKRKKSAGFMRSLMLQRLCSSYASGLATAEKLLSGRVLDDEERDTRARRLVLLDHDAFQVVPEKFPDHVFVPR